MSGLALVCARLGATVTGSDRSESSYMERLRAAGLEPRVGHDAANLPEGAEVVVSTAIADDNPELALARERGLRVDPPRRPAGRALRREAPDRRRRHPRQDDHDRRCWSGRCGRLGADPAFFVGGELPGVGADGDAANAGWGEGEWVVAEADESDGSFLRLRPRGRGRHQRRDGPPLPLGLAGRAARGLRRVRRARPTASCCPADGSARRARRRSARVPRLRRSTLPGPADARARRARRPQRANARAALAALELAGLDVDAGARGARRLPGRAPAARAEGTSAAAPASTTTTPTTRPRSAPRSRPCASSSPSASSPSSSRTSTRGPRSSPTSSAPPWRWPTRSPCSTSTRRARSRSASSPGSAASTSPARRPTRTADGASGGCPTRERPSGPGRAARRAPARRRGHGPGHARRRRRLQARRGAGRGGGDERRAAGRGRARLPARPPDHGPHRRHRRLVRPAREHGDELVALLRLGRGTRASRSAWSAPARTCWSPTTASAASRSSSTASWPRSSATASDLLCGGGARLPSAAAKAAGWGLAGLEFGVNIPGTAGGAVRMNANAYGGQLGRGARVGRGLHRRRDRAAPARRSSASPTAARTCGPARSSPAPRFRLQPGDPAEIKATLGEMRERRREAQPSGIKTFGSTFKNPDDERAEGRTAGQLLDAAGCRGLTHRRRPLRREARQLRREHGRGDHRRRARADGRGPPPGARALRRRARARGPDPRRGRAGRGGWEL